ncbi:GAF domain-containing protein [Fuscovulum ytuae]|uniref:GAF domain-containing protein n=1 Tax=Fuscovulum ytuae TaxID=3042299 RepID=A0ABY8Q2R2_9RHOB|nr:GAF domain-containing protein [Fuscovulum sp. YMD61]WGV14887.1 GAF domain-containing protein [Fuscovulum sp. YMD61]
MAVAHLYGLKPVEREAPRAPRMFVEPADFAAVAELARSIAGCERACIRLEDDETGEMRLAFFPGLPGVEDLPAALLPNGRGLTVLDDMPASRELAEAGLPELAFWAGFALKSQGGRVLGVLGLMDSAPRSLNDVTVQQLVQLSGILSLGIGMAASVIRVLARQTLGVIEDVTELEEGAASPALRGLMRYATGRLPANDEAMAMRITGLAEMVDGTLLLTETAKSILFTHGFRLSSSELVEPEAEEEVATSAAPKEFQAMARLRIGEVHHDIARDDETDKFAFRITGSDADWVLLDNGLEQGWPEMAAEIIKRTRNATFDYVRMHMIHRRDAPMPQGEYRYDLYGIEWCVRGTPEAAEARGEDGVWRGFDASSASPDNPRDFSALAAFAAIPDLETRIGEDVHEWSKRIAAGSEITPVFN